MEYFCGVLKIRNPKTLEKWLQSGRFDNEIDGGWIFNYGCGRFRKDICTCSRCKNKKEPNKSPLGKLLISYKRIHHGNTGFS